VTAPTASPTAPRPSGRIAYFRRLEHLQAILEESYRIPKSLFRSPQTLADLRTLLKHWLAVIGTMFELSTYPGSLIGGRIHTRSLRP
jgi:hypothetical protein